MKDFKLNAEGDIVIENNAIQMVSGKELTVQNVRQTLLTNAGEWEYDLGLGINRLLFFEKGVTEGMIEDNITSGLIQVDETFRLSQIEQVNDNRTLNLNFTAVNSEGEEFALEL